MMNWKGFGKKKSWPNFKVMSQHSLGGTVENHIETQVSQSPGQDLNPGPPEYKAGVLTKQL
jgi:hypothetical protein